MDANADGFGFHVATADNEHGVHFHLLGGGNFGFDVVVARVKLQRAYSTLLAPADRLKPIDDAQQRSDDPLSFSDCRCGVCRREYP